MQLVNYYPKRIIRRYAVCICREAYHLPHYHIESFVLFCTIFSWGGKACFLNSQFCQTELTKCQEAFRKYLENLAKHLEHI